MKILANPVAATASILESVLMSLFDSLDLLYAASAVILCIQVLILNEKNYVAQSSR